MAKAILLAMPSGTPRKGLQKYSSTTKYLIGLLIKKAIERSYSKKATIITITALEMETLMRPGKTFQCICIGATKLTAHFSTANKWINLICIR